MVGWASAARLATSARLRWPTPANIAKILTLAMKESSWITNTINTWDSTPRRGNPSGGLMHVTLDKVGGSKAATVRPDHEHDRVDSSTRSSQYGSLVTRSPYAQGGLVGKNSALVGERGKELVADHKTGAVRTVNQPTIMGLSGTQAVIPKGRKGAPFMEGLARSMGIPAFAAASSPT